MVVHVRSLGSTFLAAAALAAPAAAAPAPPAIVTGQDAGWPDVRAFDRFGSAALGTAPWGTWTLAFSPYPTYQKGVRVAVADVDDDGRGEIVTAPGREAFTELRVFDGRTYEQRQTILPVCNASWWNGAVVAAGDLDGDGTVEIVAGAGPGRSPEVRVFDRFGGLRQSFLAFESDYRGGVSVAAGDLDADGRAELVAGTLAVPARVRAFDGGVPAGPVIALLPPDGRGVHVGVADVNGTGRGLVLAASASGDTHSSPSSTRSPARWCATPSSRPPCRTGCARRAATSTATGATRSS